MTSRLDGEMPNEEEEQELYLTPSFLTGYRHEFQKSRKVEEHNGVGAWRNKPKMKTVRVALVLCLNIGTDPPDVVKTSPCARDECWIKTTDLAPRKALDLIGDTLQAQYERWQKRAHYKPLRDPTLEDVKKLCLQLRKAAREERVLFHYNGHGVPKPTVNGEIWVFNKNYTKYIPLAVDELQNWLGRPAMYVFDCSSASILKPFFMDDYNATNGGDSEKRNKEVIALFATGPNTWLPTNPEFPADIFTACLTTPIKMALRWFLKRNPLSTHSVTPSMLDHIPGTHQERKTPNGELNWVFTAITDTIAWNVLPRAQFHRLFRQDLLVASLFRNFLLAERIMTSLDCPPSSIPKLPSTAQHPLWDAWDLAAETCLAQLPGLLQGTVYKTGSVVNAAEAGAASFGVYLSTRPERTPRQAKVPQAVVAKPEFQACTFFTEQLTAFEVWLENASGDKRPPEQLPIVLQVLLSQMHRVRALLLLAKFLDLGPWAVDQALSVGIFPYVLKLLQSSVPELRNVLVFIWTKIMASDKSCQGDLVKDNGHVYFLRHVQAPETNPEQRVLAVFVLAVMMDGHRPGQKLCLSYQLLKLCQAHLETPDPLLRQWLCLCMSKQWEKYKLAQQQALDNGICHRITAHYLVDNSPEVRAAAVYALGTLISTDEVEEADCDPDFDRRPFDNAALSVLAQALGLCQDFSVLVRYELLIALARLFTHPRHCIALQMVAKSFAAMEKIKKEALHTPRNVSRKARAILGMEGSNNTGASAKPQGSERAKGDNESDTNNNPGGATEKNMGAVETDPAAFEQQKLENAIGSAEATQDYVNVWRVVSQMEKNDPFDKISNTAGSLLREIQLDSVGTVSTRKRSGGGSLDKPPRTIRRQMSEPLLTKEPKLSPSRLSVAIPRGYDANLVPPGTPSSKTTKLISEFDSLFRWSYQRFSEPLLQYNTIDDLDIELDTKRRDYDQWDSLNEENVHRVWLEKRNWDMIYTARSMSSGRNDTAGAQNVPVPLVGIDNLRGVENEKFEQSAILDNETEETAKLLFHPYEPILVASDARDGISIWNFEEGVKLKRFSNKNRPGTRITALEWLNDHEPSLLAVGTNDGVVRVWSGKQKRHHSSANVRLAKQKAQRVWNSLEEAGFVFGTDVDDPVDTPTNRDIPELSTHRAKENLITAWNAAPDLIPRGGSGMITAWQQCSGRLYVGGNCKSIRAWDLESEKCVSNVLSGSSDACLTAMTSDWDDALNSRRGEIIAGFADGSLRVYDDRIGGSAGVIMSNHTGHRSWIVNVNMQRGHLGTLSTGSISGDIQLWDIRNSLSSPVKTLEAEKGTPMTTMAMQDYAPIIASGSNKQFIKIFNTSGKVLSTIKYHDGFLGQRIGMISCLAFHPHLPVLASGAVDSIIAIYKSSIGKR